MGALRGPRVSHGVVLALRRYRSDVVSGGSPGPVKKVPVVEGQVVVCIGTSSSFRVWDSRCGYPRRTSGEEQPGLRPGRLGINLVYSPSPLEGLTARISDTGGGGEYPWRWLVLRSHPSREVNEQGLRRLINWKCALYNK